MTKGAIVSRAEDFPRWYQEVIARAEMADNGPVRGTMVIRPWGYGIWELLQAELDRRIKEAGAENAYFPLFIPESYLSLEAEHVEGFSPELAVVTHGGGKKLEEPVVVRPTSETVINSFFAKWIQSHRDLPLLINQWANVVRWELRPRLFLRTTEFLWQEGHTAHATEADARAYALRSCATSTWPPWSTCAACPVLTGPQDGTGALRGGHPHVDLRGDDGDGKALQMGTSHELGQNFARAFGITFTNAEGVLEYVWQTSWGCRPGSSARWSWATATTSGCACRRRWPRPGGGAHGQRGPGVRLGGRGTGGRAAARTVIGCGSTTGPRPASGAGAWTGSSKACRSGWRSVPGIWPRGMSPW